MGALTLTAKVETTGDVLAGLDRLNPGKNQRIAASALTECMLLTLRNAATKGIYPGGGRDAPVRPDILTSRTGTLRRSLSSSFALDRSGLPRYIEGGTSLVYGAVHEYGGRYHPSRPFLAPGLRLSEGEFEGIFVKWWEREGQK